MTVFSKVKSFSLDSDFDEKKFENIFLHNYYPDAGTEKKKSATKTASIDEKAELWALYDLPTRYHGLNMLRELRTLWGIHLTLKIGPRSETNPAVRGICHLPSGQKKQHSIFFEGYNGNVSDATREIIVSAPYNQNEKSRALSQKYFVRFVIPLKELPPLLKIDALLLAYSIAAVMDKKYFAGLVDPDLYLFVPPQSVRAGLAHYHRRDRLLNTHLVSGFNFFQTEGAANFFTHGLNRFGMPDLLLNKTDAGEALVTDNYAMGLKTAHNFFLNQLLGVGKKEKYAPLKKSEHLPEQVTAMMGKNVVALPLPLSAARETLRQT